MTKMETALASERTHFMAHAEKHERERDNANQERDWAREHNNAMRMAGCDLATAALRVVRDYDGVHRLALAVSAWAQVLADQGGRDAALDERSES